MWILVIVLAMVVGAFVWLKLVSNNAHESRAQIARPTEIRVVRPVIEKSSDLDLKAQLETATRELEASLPALIREVEAEIDAEVEVLREELPSPPPTADLVADDVPPISSDPLEQGPSWMAPDEWADRLAAYRRQRRGDREIREVRAHLERRGPLVRKSPEELVSRAATMGVVSRAEYMEPDVETEALALGADGLPDARLELVRDRLLVVTPRGVGEPQEPSRSRSWSLLVRPQRNGVLRSSSQDRTLHPGSSSHSRPRV